jgi:glycosyltransferase involved in cell wall biosynthesis
MQAGVPIVASDTGGIPGIAGGAAHLVPPGDAAALARALDAVLTDRREAARIAAIGSERVRSFDWGLLAGEVLRVYESAVAARVRRTRGEPLAGALERRVAGTR